MPKRERNDFLEARSSDEENNTGYDSEAADGGKESKIANASSYRSKRRCRTSGGSSSDKERPTLEDTASDAPTVTGDVQKPEIATKPSQVSTKPPTKARKPRKPLTPGILYLSRIPPFMRPSTVRTLLTPYGPITRLFLTPEAPTTHHRRVSSGGNRKRSFIDGWIEFSRKKHAKLCAQAINGNIVGGKKGGWYHDDVWNAKYLRGFAWADLMAGVEGEERAREARGMAERAREKRERVGFLKGVEEGKKWERREGKRRAREEREVGGVSAEGTDRVEGVKSGKAGVEDGKEGKRPKGNGLERRFRQNEVRTQGVEWGGGKEQSDEVKRVLSKIF